MFVLCTCPCVWSKQIRSLEDELAALRNKHVQGGEAGGRR
jgi:hypothetical protein